MCFTAPVSGEVRRKERQAALTFCRQTAAACTTPARPPLRRLGATLPDSLAALNDRGAVERVLSRPNWVLRSMSCSGLLRGIGIARHGIRAGNARAWMGTKATGAGGVGAPIARRLTRSWQTLYRACGTLRGHLLPASPCMNELPSHAPTFNSCLLRPERLYVHAQCAGVKKLF